MGQYCKINVLDACIDDVNCGGASAIGKPSRPVMIKESR